MFTYLPVERGDRLDASLAAEAIRALYGTGFFEDVRLDRQGDILVVTVVERPAINKLTLTGNKDIKTEDLTKGLKDIGLAEGETFDRLSLDRVTQELNRQYNNRGKYNVEITPAVSRLDRNRVDVTITVKEGKAAKIQHINLVGNEKFGDETITDGWESREHNWLSWYSRDDQYSREKLSGDMEKLTSWYLDRGYVDFSLDSTQVAISPDRQRHVHHRRPDRGRAVQDLQRQGHRRHDPPAGRSREDGPREGGPDLLAPPAGVHVRRHHRDARQHRLRLRAGEPDSRSRMPKTRPSASTSRSCRARASTCAASSSRATRAPPTKCCAAKCASSKARGIRRPPSTARRSACSAWATSKRSKSRTCRSPAPTTRST